MVDEGDDGSEADGMDVENLSGDVNIVDESSDEGGNNKIGGDNDGRHSFGSGNIGGDTSFCGSEGNGSDCTCTDMSGDGALNNKDTGDDSSVGND